MKNLIFGLFFFVGLLYSENEVTRVRYIGLKDLKPETTIHFILSKLSVQQQEDFFSKLMLNEEGLAMQIFYEPLLGLEKYEVAAVFKYFGMSGDHDFWSKETDKQQLFGELHSFQENNDILKSNCGDHKGYACVYRFHQWSCRKDKEGICNTCICK